MPEISETVLRAIHDAKQHPSVISIAAPQHNVTSGISSFMLTLEIPLPNAWRASGQSPNGVKLFEEVRFDFSQKFPLKPPEISLRDNFSRELAHLQPWLTADKRPVPCIVLGDLGEFYINFGVLGIITQLVGWLSKAAEESLIDLDQGWEPRRRDNVSFTLVADEIAIRDTIDERGGFKFFAFRYNRIKDELTAQSLHGEISQDQFTINKKSVEKIFTERSWQNYPKNRSGTSLALVIWAGKSSSGDLIISDKYAPEDVSTLAGLKALSIAFECERSFDMAFGILQSTLAEFTADKTFAFPVIFCVRRPAKMIATDSNVELVPFLFEMGINPVFPEGNNTAVFPASLRQSINADLLFKLSGGDPAAPNSPKRLSLIGAGSLGSKIALHLARCGWSPSVIIDNKTMAPHNFARHALLPSPRVIQTLPPSYKAFMLAEAVENFGQNCQPLVADFIYLSSVKKEMKIVTGDKTFAVLNTTASLAVREAIGSIETNIRAMEAVMFSRGKVGVLVTEGKEKNPCLNDLFAEFFAICYYDASLKPLVFPNEESLLETVEIGQGCGSVTMPMSDGRLSVFSAGISERLLSFARAGLPHVGNILIGQLSEDDISASYKSIDVAPVIIVDIDDIGSWKIRLHDRAAKKIREEVSLYPTVETGGVLIGRISLHSKTFHVVDVLEAPEDSVRSASQFTLGRKGLHSKLDEYGNSSNWALYSLGTWHSHLVTSGPSQMDRDTAKIIGGYRTTPSILLIHTPGGYRALMADSFLEG
ncbi:MAG: hypothetical protein DI586_08140 [Micavibrio aeruginosavorus]|uniref:JAB domain-containing protein n=1 Tax=Micavibrio aeruginosavorus TaxID=349221 RepID=A0A2W5FMF4_9BACT|nr:MAG: hypothetical protein DI586_08140 [Micavibrio aeruginosavorus]